MAVMGENGVREAARQCNLKARYLKRRLRALEGVSIPFSAPTIHEFVYETTHPAGEVLAALRSAGITGGVALSRWEAGEPAAHRILVCCTEQNDRPNLDRYVRTVASVMGAE